MLQRQQQVVMNDISKKEVKGPPRVAISSDFIDFYDHAFYPRDFADVVWDRRSRTEMPKREQFQLLEILGLRTPTHGTVLEVFEKFRKQLPGFTDELFHLYAHTIRVVVYLDEYAHKGEGKVLLSLADALRDYPRLYCSRYIECLPHLPGFTYSTSYRHLQIGPNAYMLKYTGYGSWMSNHAPEVEVEKVFDLGEATCGQLASGLPYPVFAVDFVQAGPQLYAVDVNTAPGLDGIDLGLAPEDIYSLVARWYECRGFEPKKEETMSNGKV